MGAVLDLSLDQVSEHIETFGGKMVENFHLPPAELDPLYADEAWILAGQPDAKRSEQIATHLQLLGYLDDRAGTIPETEVNAALLAWEQDFADAQRDGMILVHYDAQERRRLDQLPWTERRVRELKALATFEGEVVLTRVPPSGEVTLASRILHMRLRSYGLARVVDHETTDTRDRFLARDPFGDPGRAALEAGALIFFNRRTHDPLEVINLLGNAPAATDAFLGHRGAWPGLFRGERRPAGIGRVAVQAPEARRRRWVNRDGQWQFDVTIPATKQRPSFTEQPRLRDSVVTAYAQHPFTVVGLELLQLRLWMFGYYLGAVDGVWGQLSEDALRAFGREHADILGSGDADVYLRTDKNGWGLINLGLVLGVIVDHLDAVAERLSSTAMQRVAEDTVDGIKSDDWAEVDRAYEKHRARERALIAAPTLSTAKAIQMEGDGGTSRKRYFGWRRFFAAAGAFLRRVGGAIKNAFRTVIQALKDGVGQAFEVLRYLWRKVRVAVRIGRLAVRRFSCWLTGTPLCTIESKHLVATAWSLDFDTVQVVSDRCPDAISALHDRRLHWMSASLAFMSRLALFVLELVSAAIASWLLVAYRVFRFFRELLGRADLRGLFSDSVLERGLI